MIVPTEEEIRNKAHYLYDREHDIWWIHDPELDKELKRENFWEKARAQLEAETREEWIARLERNIKAVEELIEKHGPTERVYHYGPRRFYGDEEWEKFVQSHLWAGRVEPKPTKVETIDWLEHREKLEKRLEEVKGRVTPPPKPLKGIPPEELPEEIRGYVELLHVNVVEKPEEKLLPGFKAPTWVIPVHDEGTCDTMQIVHRHPYSMLEKYQLVKITNKKGDVITVLTLKEEWERLAVPSPKEEEIQEAVSYAQKAVPERVATAPIDWKWLRGLATRIQSWIKSAEAQAEKRNAIAVYTMVSSIADWLNDAKKKMLEGAEVLRMHEARMEKPVIKILKDYEYEALWESFSQELKEEGIDPEDYKERFDALIAWNMDFFDNEAVLMDEVRGIILEKKMKKYLKKLPLKPVRFSWKWLGWGLSSLKVEAGVLRDAVKQENAIQAYTTATKMNQTAEKLRGLLELHPEVIGFKELRKRSSD
jgi:hypothetical protein